MEPDKLATKVALPEGPKIADTATAEWLKLLKVLDDSGILRLASERELPRGFAGESFKCRVFVVAKDDGMLRTILNRVRRNATEESRDGVTPTFPHGSSLAEIILAEGEKVRVSVDDLPDYYNWFWISEERVLTYGFGTAISYEEARKLRAWAHLSDGQRAEIARSPRRCSNMLGVSCRWGISTPYRRRTRTFCEAGEARQTRRSSFTVGRGRPAVLRRE